MRIPLRLELGTRLWSDTAPESGRHYWVERRIGTGGTAQVFAVRDGDGNLYAAKILSDHRFEIDAQMRKRFAREAKVLLMVESPNLLRLVETLEFEESLVVVLEYAGGGSVAQVLNALNGPLPIPICLGWLNEALGGVAALHKAGAVHRDLSPKNLLLRADASLAVSDLGTVRRHDETTLTEQGVQMGSLLYISPQQFEDPHKADPGDDVYSLGQLAWHLLTGRRPIGNTPPALRLRTDIPDNLAELVERMRAHDPDERPRDANTALDELNEIFDDASVKPALRRGSRKSALGGLVETPLTASVKAIATSQRNDLEKFARRYAQPGIAWALDTLVQALGPLHFDLEGHQEDAQEISSDEALSLPAFLTSGSVEAQLIGSDDLLVLRNSITGRSVSYSLRAPAPILDLPLPLILRNLARVSGLREGEQRELWVPFGEGAFLYGVPCAVCSHVTGSHLFLTCSPDRDGSGRLQIFRAGSCAQHAPGAHMCTICGDLFERRQATDSSGAQYDGVGCACPDLAFESPYDDQPWEGGVYNRSLVEVFEQP